MRNRVFLVALGFSLLLTGCHTDMWVQPKVRPQSKSDFWTDDKGSRPSLPETIEFQQPKLASAFSTGYQDGRLVEEIPMMITAETLERGHERFKIFCQPCHGAAGDGQGMIAARGYAVERPIPSYHTDRLRAMPVGHFFDVLTNGYGAMYRFSDRIEEEDRWAIAAWIRVLQLSQNADFGSLSTEQRDEFMKTISAESVSESTLEGGAH